MKVSVAEKEMSEDECDSSGSEHSCDNEERKAEMIRKFERDLPSVPEQILKNRTRLGRGYAYTPEEDTYILETLKVFEKKGIGQTSCARFIAERLSRPLNGLLGHISRMLDPDKQQIQQDRDPNVSNKATLTDKVVAKDKSQAERKSRKYFTPDEDARILAVAKSSPDRPNFGKLAAELPRSPSVVYNRYHLLLQPGYHSRRRKQDQEAVKSESTTSEAEEMQPFTFEEDKQLWTAYTNAKRSSAAEVETAGAAWVADVAQRLDRSVGLVNRRLHCLKAKDQATPLALSFTAGGGHQVAVVDLHKHKKRPREPAVQEAEHHHRSHGHRQRQEERQRSTVAARPPTPAPKLSKAATAPASEPTDPTATSVRALLKSGLITPEEARQLLGR